MSPVAALAPLGGHQFTSVTVDLVSVVLVAVGVVYAVGVRRFGALHPGQGWSVRRTAAFMAGLAVALVSLDTFIGVYDRELFYVHMIQHLMLIMVAAPLLAMGAPADGSGPGWGRGRPSSWPTPSWTSSSTPS